MNDLKLLYALSFVFSVFFIMREYMAYKRNLTFKYFFTPLLTLLLVAMMLLSVIINGADRYRIMILLSLLSALVADTLLMIEETDLLKNGMVFFILAHIFYIIAFSDGYLFKMWNIILIFAMLFMNIIYLRKMSNPAGKMFIPVLVYTLILNLMVYSAISRLNSGVSFSSVSSSAGVILFMFSDFILSVNAFVKPIKNSTVFTWLLYAPAQYLIVLSTFADLNK